MKRMVLVVAGLTLTACQALYPRSIEDLRGESYRYRAETLNIDFDQGLSNYQRHAYVCNGAPALLISPDRSAARASYAIPGWVKEAAMAAIELARADGSIAVNSYAYVGSGFDGRPFVDRIIKALTDPTICHP